MHHQKVWYNYNAKDELVNKRCVNYPMQLNAAYTGAALAINSSGTVTSTAITAFQLNLAANADLVGPFNGVDGADSLQFVRVNSATPKGEIL